MVLQSVVICLLAEKLTQERARSPNPARDMFERLAKNSHHTIRGKLILSF